MGRRGDTGTRRGGGEKVGTWEGGKRGDALLTDARRSGMILLNLVGQGTAMQDDAITYRDAGVDIDAKAQISDRIRHLVRQTYSPRVIDRLGSFAGLFRLDYDEKLFERNYKDPVLAACTDGVGTKIEIARMMGKYDTVGIDAVAMNVNDLIVMGAEPLFFLDYLAVHEIDHDQLAGLVKGISDGCRLAGCALLGGETADMPDIYGPGKFDLAGFAVGVLEQGRLIDGRLIQPGDQLIALSSSGLHSNGYSLVRKICFDRLKLDPRKPVADLDPDRPLGEVLLEPTRIYAGAVMRLLGRYKRKRPIRGMAHITGGGLAGNVERVLPKACDAEIDKKSWPRPKVFDWLSKAGPVSDREMWRVFNMGIGYVFVVNPTFRNSILYQLRRMGETPHVIGHVKKGSGKVLVL